MKYWRKILSGVVVLAAAGVVTGIVIIESLDFNEYRGLIAEQVKSATGRDLTISGELNLALSLSPSVVVEGVTFANAPWGSRKEMVKLKRLAAEVELLPLLTGDVRIKRLVLVGLDLWAETDAKGRGNWELGPTGLTARRKAETKSSGPGTLPVVNRVRIENLNLTYHDGRSGKKTTLRIANMDFRSDGLDAPMNISLTGDLNGLAVKLSGRFGSLEALMKGGAPYPVAFDLTVPGVSLKVHGAIAEPRKARGLDLKLSVDAQDLGPLAKAAGLTLPKIQAFKVTAGVSDPRGGYRLDGLKAEIGGSDLEGWASVTLAGVARPAVSAELTSKLIDLDALLPPGPAGKAPTKGKEERMFAADPLPTGGLKAADARVKVNIGRLVTGGIAVNDVELALVLGAGRLDVKPLKATIGGGKINGNLVVDGSGAVPAITVNLEARQIDYGAVLEQLQLTGIASGKVDADLNLKGRGSSVRAIMAGLDGRARIVTRGGKVESGLLNVLSADVLSALPFVDSKGDKDIRCAIVDFDIRKGQASAKALVFETGGLGMIGRGGVNLKDETIDINIDPRAKKISLLKLTMVPVNVGGTLANPTVIPDLGGAAIGVVAGAVSTATDIAKGAVSTATDIAKGGVSALGKLVGLGGNKEPGGASGNVDDTDYCKLALAGRALVRAKAKQSPPASSSASQPPPRSPPKPTLGGSTADKLDRKLDEIGKGLGGALKGLLGK